MNLLRLALRNLARNTRRTLITGFGIALGLALMFTSNNLAGGQYDDMIDKAVANLAGHVVVQAQGYQADPEPDKLVARSAEVDAALAAAFPDGVVTRRLFLGGLLTSPYSARSVQLTGIEPGDEGLVSDVRDDLVDGEWLDDDDRALVIGRVLARALEVDPGDRVVLMVQVGGDMTSRMFRVRGILDSGLVERESMRAYTTLGAAQALLDRGDVAHQVAVHLHRGVDADAAAEVARDAVDPDGREILPWPDALPEIADAIRLDAMMSDIMWSLMGIIVAMGVLNTILMSTLERTREFGVMMAVGMRPGRIGRLVLLEALLLGFAAAVVGVALGSLFTWPLAVYGLDMTGSMGESYEMADVQISAIMYASWDWPRNLLFAAAAVLVTVLAAAWPAWRVSRLTPVQAMHHV